MRNIENRVGTPRKLNGHSWVSLIESGLDELSDVPGPLSLASSSSCSRRANTARLSSRRGGRPGTICIAGRRTRPGNAGSHTLVASIAAVSSPGGPGRTCQLSQRFGSQDLNRVGTRYKAGNDSQVRQLLLLLRTLLTRPVVCP
jgi:hypothetical protein